MSKPNTPNNELRRPFSSVMLPSIHEALKFRAITEKTSLHMLLEKGARHVLENPAKRSKQA